MSEESYRFGRNLKRLRIHGVPDFKDKCAVCSEIAMGCHFDHDLAPLAHGRGYVCNQCSWLVICAETALIDAGLTTPTDSILERERGLL